MKFKATNKEMKNNYHYIISVGYCDAESLLTYHNPIAYNSGVYGWNQDFYEIFGDVLIATGYRPINRQNTKYDYNLVREYNKQAREIINGMGSYEEKKEKVNSLLSELIGKLLEG